MLVYAFYNVVDTIFVGRALGEESVSGIGGLVIAFPIHMLAMGVAIGLGVGGSSIVSRALGSKELHRAEKALGTVFFLGVFLGLAYSLIGLSFIEPLLKLFGATPGIMPYARSYLEIIMARFGCFYPRDRSRRPCKSRGQRPLCNVRNAFRSRVEYCA